MRDFLPPYLPQPPRLSFLTQLLSPSPPLTTTTLSAVARRRTATLHRRRAQPSPPPSVPHLPSCPRPPPSPIPLSVAYPPELDVSASVMRNSMPEFAAMQCLLHRNARCMATLDGLATHGGSVMRKERRLVAGSTQRWESTPFVLVIDELCMRRAAAMHEHGVNALPSAPSCRC